MARKLVKLAIKETSGVDHPAHLHDGWVVMKSANPADADAVLDEIRSTEIVDKALADSDSVVETETTDVDTTKAANAVLETITHFQKEEIMSETLGVNAPEVVIVADDATNDAVIKAMPASIRKMLEDSAASAAAATATAEQALAKAAASEEALIAERNARADEAAVIKAAAWSNLTLDPSTVGPALRRLSESDPDLASEVVKALDSANAVAVADSVFTEIGGDTAPDPDSAFGEVDALAKARVADGKATTYAEAIMAVAQENPSLYERHLKEAR